VPTVQLTINRHKIAAEVATTPEQRATGLMHRFSILPDHGMLFVFERAEPQAFWMKNTFIPLSIAFIAADGRIANIDDMAPQDERLHNSPNLLTIKRLSDKKKIHVGRHLTKLQPVLSLDQLSQLQQAVRDVRVDDAINEYLLRIVQATRSHPELSLGISTRGALTLYRAAQSYALIDQRNYVIPDDIKRLAVPVLAHRAVGKGLIRDGERDRVKLVIRQILEKTAVPK